MSSGLVCGPHPELMAALWVCRVWDSGIMRERGPLQEQGKWPTSLPFLSFYLVPAVWVGRYPRDCPGPQGTYYLVTEAGLLSLKLTARLVVPTWQS